MSPPGADDATTARRRRALELALARRPEMTLGEVHRVLVALDLDADTATVVDDLDALGFDLADAPPGGAPGDPVALDPAAVDAAVASATTPPAPDAAALPWWQTRVGVAIAAGAVLLSSVAIAAGLASRDGDEGAPTTVATLPVEGPTGSGAAEGSSSTTGPLTTAPPGPGADPALDDGGDGSSGFDDAFGADLGRAPDGAPWEVVAGTWIGRDAQATLDAVDGEAGTGLAVFDPALASYRLQVRIAEQAAGTGLVFGVVDADTYHAVVAAPEYATFNLVRVVDGEVEPLGNSGLTEAGGGAAVVGVHVTPTAVEVLVQGAVAITEPLAAPLEATAMGIGSVPGAAGGVFDEVSYRADP